MEEERTHMNKKFNLTENLSEQGVLADLVSIARQKEIPVVDYTQQIIRWNSYQQVLDDIDKKCIKTNGDVWLKRNIRHNAKFLDETAAGFLIAAGLFALIMVGVATASNNFYGVVGAAIAITIVGWQAFIRLHPPSLIHFVCKPALHIDEFAYMNKAIKGIRKVQRDPVVNLPPIEMSIPRRWLVQQGLLDFMTSLEEISAEKRKVVE